MDTRSFAAGVLPFALLVVSLFIAPLAPKAQEGLSYIMVGHVEPNAFGMFIRSAAGEVKPLEELRPVAQQYADRYRAKGWPYIWEKIATPGDLKRVLTDPKTKAIAWFSHGNNSPDAAHILTTADDQEVSPAMIKGWAREDLAKTYPWLADLSRNDGVVPPEWREGLHPEEVAWRRAIWMNAHFQLEEAYLHVCYGLSNMEWGEVLLAEGGTIRGYPDKAYLSDTSREFLRPSAPVLTTELVGPEKKEFLFKQKFTLAAKAQGGTPPLKHEWRMPNGRVVVGRETQITAVEAGWHKIFLRVTDASIPPHTARGEFSFKVLTGSEPPEYAEPFVKTQLTQQIKEDTIRMVYGLKKNPTTPQTLDERLRILERYFNTLEKNDRVALFGCIHFRELERVIRNQGAGAPQAFDRTASTVKYALF